MPEDFKKTHSFVGVSVDLNVDGTTRVQMGRKDKGDGIAYADLTNAQTRVLIGRLMRIAGIELATLTPEGALVMKDFD